MAKKRLSKVNKRRRTQNVALNGCLHKLTNKLPPTSLTSYPIHKNKVKRSLAYLNETSLAISRYVVMVARLSAFLAKPTSQENLSVMFAKEISYSPVVQ